MSGRLWRNSEIIEKCGLRKSDHLGCLDPTSVWLYYLCGADIFDGLSWLRYVFWEGKALHRNSWAILTKQTELFDEDLIFRSYLNNLQVLKNMQRRMGQFAKNRDLSFAENDSNLLMQNLSLAGIAFS